MEQEMKVGEVYQTKRDKNKVEILAINGPPDTPVVGMYVGGAHAFAVGLWKANGDHAHWRGSDLVEVPKVREGWVAVYTGISDPDKAALSELFDTKEACQRRCQLASAIIKITYTAGEGLV